MKSVIAVGATLALACSASTIVKPGTANVANAPVNEMERPGIVGYLNDGASRIREARRADAYKKMQESCGGPYKIDSEGEKVEGGSVVPTTSGGWRSFSSHHWYIQYSCVRSATKDSTSH